MQLLEPGRDRRLCSEEPLCAKNYLCLEPVSSSPKNLELLRILSFRMDQSGRITPVHVLPGRAAGHLVQLAPIIKGKVGSEK